MTAVGQAILIAFLAIGSTYVSILWRNEVKDEALVITPDDATAVIPIPAYVAQHRGRSALVKALKARKREQDTNKRYKGIHRGHTVSTVALTAGAQ